MSEEEKLIECAMRGVQLYAEKHPRPVHVNLTQAAEMLRLSHPTVSKMVRAGRIAVNGLGLVPISEIDRVLSVR